MKSETKKKSVGSVLYDDVMGGLKHGICHHDELR